MLCVPNYGPVCVQMWKYLLFASSLDLYHLSLGSITSIFISVSHSNKYIITWLHKLSFWLSYLGFLSVVCRLVHESGFFLLLQLKYYVKCVCMWKIYIWNAPFLFFSRLSSTAVEIRRGEPKKNNEFGRNVFKILCHKTEYWMLWCYCGSFSFRCGSYSFLFGSTQHNTNLRYSFTP